MQSQMIGMQSSLDIILSAVQSQNSNLTMGYQQPMFSNGPDPPREGSADSPPSQRGLLDMGLGPNERRPPFPPLPGFIPPVSLIWLHDASYVL